MIMITYRKEKDIRKLSEHVGFLERWILIILVNNSVQKKCLQTAVTAAAVNIRPAMYINITPKSCRKSPGCMILVEILINIFWYPLMNRIGIDRLPLV